MEVLAENTPESVTPSRELIVLRNARMGALPPPYLVSNLEEPSSASSLDLDFTNQSNVQHQSLHQSSRIFKSASTFSTNIGYHVFYNTTELRRL